MRSDRLMECVDAFAEQMKVKLRKKRAQGFSGWDDENELQYITDIMMQHAEELAEGKNEAVDLANLAMMIWNLTGRPKP